MALSSKLLAVLLVALATLSMAAAQTPPPPPPPAAPPSSGNGTTCEPARLRVCSSLLGGLLLGLGGGSNATSDAQCCSLLGIAGVDAGVCLCTALRTNVLGILNLNVPLALRLLLGQCGTPAPAGFTCPST